MQIYPGTYDYWWIVWIQAILFVYVQLTTALTLYTQSGKYSAFIIKPLERLLPWKGRELVVKVHAVNGIVLFTFTLFCTTTWFYQKVVGGLSLRDILLSVNETAIIGWINISTTFLLTLMGIFGISLYRNNNPHTILPFWRFDYNISRLIHRLVFIFLITFLGYHIFFIKKIYIAWIDWTVTLHPFVFIFFGIIILGSCAFAMALVMLIEIPKVEMFTGKKRMLDISLYLALVFVTFFAISCLKRPLESTTFVILIIFSAVVPALLSTIPKPVPKSPVKFKTITRVSEELLSQPEALEVAKYVKEALKRGEEMEDILNYSAALYLRLRGFQKDIRQVNEIEDIGKSIAAFLLSKLLEGGVSDD